MDAFSKSFDIPPERVFKTIHKYGNTSASGVGIALDELLVAHPPATGEHILLVAFGGGLTWGRIRIEQGGGIIMATQKKIAFIFPGQGAQYCGMGKDFASQYAVARQTFEEADDLLGRKLSKIAFEGPEDALTETRNSQTAIYVNSMAILRTLHDLFPILQPSVCAGLSLGEYTALTCAGYLPFEACLPIVQYRGQYMNEACEERRGVMAAVIGLSADEVEAAVQAANLPNDLWVANFNCPGQTVIFRNAKGCGSWRRAH
jgi:[acyl-carrier-protein] S-malonyltransferase